MQVVVRMGVAGNGTPVFMTAGQSRELARPFGATWDADRHLWLYPAYYPAAKKVLDDFKVLDSHIKLEFSDTASEYIREVERTDVRYAALELPAGFEFVTKPFAHQILGLCHVFYMMRAALFYAPGLGKSKIAVDWMRLLRFLGDKGLTIVMGPVVTVRNWGKEIDRHSGGQLKWGAVLGTKTQKTKVIERAAAGEFDALLVTYDTAKNFIELLIREVPYTRIVADESHGIKSFDAARTKAAHELGQKAVRKIIMTGTPTLGSPLDLYGQYKFLGDYFMPEGYFHFKQKYLVHSPYNKHVITGYKNLDILNKRTQFLSLRKTKEECLDLPPQTFVDVDYDLSRHQSVIYNQLIEQMGLDVGLLIAQLGGAASDVMPSDTKLPHAAALLNKLMQVASGFLIKNNQDTKLCDNTEPGGCRYVMNCVSSKIEPYTKGCLVASAPLPNTITVFDDNPKLDALEGIFDSVLEDENNKVIVWCYYKAELDLISKLLEKLKLPYVKVDGSTGDRVQALADKFNDDPKVRVYLAQVSTGVGITLNAAAYMVYYSLPFALGSYLQSLDRNYRIGQSKNVTVYRLLGRGTIEPAIVKLLDNKVDVDTVLTQKLSCIVCEQSMKCFAEGIGLFDAGCVYQRNVDRPVTRMRVIKY